MKRYLIFAILTVLAVTASAETLTLNKAVEIAQLRSETIAIASEKVFAAREDALAVKSGFYPRISGQGSYTRLNEAPSMTMPGPMGTSTTIEMGTADNYKFTISAQQPLFMGGAILNGYKAASSMAQAQEKQLSAEKNNLFLDVAEAWYGVIKADAFRKTAMEARLQMEEHLNTLERMYSAGILSHNELLKAKVQLSNIRMMEIQAENAGTLSRLALNMAMGVPLDTVYEFPANKTFTDTYKSLPDLDLAIRNAIRDRQDVSALKNMTDAAGYGLKIAKSSMVPSVVSVFNYDWKNTDSSFPPELDSSWNLTIMATMDLFTAGERRHKIHKAESDLNQAEIGLSLARKGVEFEVRAQYATIREKQKAVEIAEIKLEQAEEEYKVASAEFKLGMATSTDVLDASTSLVGAKTDYVSVLSDRQIAYIKFEVVSGQKPNINEE